MATTQHHETENQIMGNDKNLCRSCKGSGKCPGCKGTNSHKCGRCNMTGKCRACGGKG